MYAAAFPREGDGAGDMIKSAGGAAGLGFILGPTRHLASKADGLVGQGVKTVAPALRNAGGIVDPRMQVGSQRRLCAVAPDRALQRIERDDVAGAFQIEPRWASRSNRGVANSSM